MVLQPQIAQIKGHVERHCFHIIEFRQFYALQNEIELNNQLHIGGNVFLSPLKPSSNLNGKAINSHYPFNIIILSKHCLRTFGLIPMPAFYYQNYLQ